MSYKEKPQIKLYKYQNNNFVLQAVIDDYQECSFERNLYQAGTFTVTINYNIPNSHLFQRGLFIQFGNDPYDFGEIATVQDSIGQDGKGSQIRTITGYDARYLLKRRIIKNMNFNGLWVMTAKGELCLRNLIKDQCGSGAETKRQLPISNIIPSSANAIGEEYSVSEQFTNLYEVCSTIATQSEIGWRIGFDGTSMYLNCYKGTDRSQTVQFSTSFDSLANGKFVDSSESFCNAVYVGGKGDNEERDIYEGENGTPSGLDRFESWDNQAQMTTEEEYEIESKSILSQYGQTVDVMGNGLAKCPYIYKEQYNVGDLITIAFSGKSAVVQILSVTERWVFGNYDIQFSFGKPINGLTRQLQNMLRKIQEASNKTESTTCVKWYTITNTNSMPKADVTFNTLGFTGAMTQNKTFTLYLDNERTGSKNYTIYTKNLTGNYKLTLTTGKSGATNFVLKGGVNAVAKIYIDPDGNIIESGMTATSVIETGNNQPLSSDGATALQPVDTVASGNLHSVTSNAVARNNIHAIRDYWTDDINNPIDVLSIIESYGDLLEGMSEEIKIRICSFATNSPYGVGVQNCDFLYSIQKISVSQNKWIRVTAYDVRSHNIFTNVKQNGSWWGWGFFQFANRFTDTSPILTPNELLGWARMEGRSGVFTLLARFANYTTQHTFAEGDIIGRLKPEYYPTSGGFPVNVHNFPNDQEYMLWIGEDGYIKIYGIGSQTMFYDFYINATYEI